MSEDRVPTYIPGDVIAYYIIFACEVNVSSVSAAFRNESTGTEIVLKGTAQMEANPRVRGARAHSAALSCERVATHELDSGRYRLARLEARTYGGKTLDFDNPSEDAFRFEEEPEEISLPKLARGIVEPASGFLLEDGHPNKPPDQ